MEFIKKWLRKLVVVIEQSATCCYEYDFRETGGWQTVEVIGVGNMPLQQITHMATLREGSVAEDANKIPREAFELVFHAAERKLANGDYRDSLGLSTISKDFLLEIMKVGRSKGFKSHIPLMTMNTAL